MKRNRTTNKCLACDVDFEIKVSRKDTAKYCSKKCMTKVRQITIKCEVCSKKTDVKLSRKNTAKYCSKACFAKGYIGHPPYNFKGGKMIHKGYTYIMAKGHPNSDRDGYVAEHRLIVEKQIGRYLERGEVVHHLNHNRSDNRPENIVLLSSQSEHMKLHAPDLVIIAKTKPHPFLGRKHSQEARLKMSKTRLLAHKEISERVTRYWAEKRKLKQAGLSTGS